MSQVKQGQLFIHKVTGKIYKVVDLGPDIAYLQLFIEGGNYTQGQAHPKTFEQVNRIYRPWSVAA